MTLADVRLKWNRRYQERPDEASLPEPNPLALRFAARVRGGMLLDAACGLGAGIAAAIDRVDLAIGVDLSEVALAAARRAWGPHPKIRWIQGDVARLAWPPDTFSLVCAFGFTDWAFLRGVPRIVRPGGLFCYQGFSRRQLEVKPGLDPDWTSTPEAIAALFPGWCVLACEESAEPPFRVSYAGQRPGTV
jgi:tellurite methyltransferase